MSADRAELAVSLAAPLARWWWARGLLTQMAGIADATAELPSAAALPPASAGLLRWARGTMRIALGRTAEAAPLLADVVADATARDDPWLLGHGLVGLAMTRPPEDPELPGMFTEAVAALRRSGDVWSVAFALVPHGDVALLSGDLAGGRPRARGGAGPRPGARRRPPHRDPPRPAGARRPARRGRRRPPVTGSPVPPRCTAPLGDQEGLAYCLDGLAGLALLTGDARTAARLSGAADAVRTSIGVAVWPLLQSLVAQLADGVRAALGEAEERRERAAGAATDPWEALEAGLAAARAGR